VTAIVVIGMCRVSRQDHQLLGALPHPFHPSKDAVSVVELLLAEFPDDDRYEATRAVSDEVMMEIRWDGRRAIPRS